MIGTENSFYFRKHPNSHWFDDDFTGFRNRCARIISILVSILIQFGCYESSVESKSATEISNRAVDGESRMEISPPTDPEPLSKNDAPQQESDVRFVNVAHSSGLTDPIFCGGPNKEHILESVGSGCAWIDYDSDGQLDVFLTNAWALDDEPRRIRQKGRSRLYRNLGRGRFEDVTASAGVGVEDWGCGVTAADFDNDGHVDLYLTNFGANRLFRNRGDGTFEDISSRSGVAIDGWSAGAAFFDADGDGWLDLYVVRYIDCTWEDVLAGKRTNTWRDTAKVMVGPFGLKGGTDKFFHNNQDGTFTDVTDEVGMTDTAESYGLGVIASDLDLDGDVDVYVANDSNPNFLYRNDGKGKFTEIGGWNGAGVSAEGRAQGGMGVDAADLTGDGLPEIVVTNFAHDYSTIYKNEGDLFFSDVSREMGINESTYVQVSWGCAFLDVDLDTQQDLLILNGHIYPQVDQHQSLRESYKQLPALFRGNDRKFENLTSRAGPGMQIAESMRGLAIGDYDNDGRPDLLITAIDVPPLLLHNESSPNSHWATIRALNRTGGPAVNAVVRLTSAGRTQYREIRSGSTYCSQNSFDAYFGLGTTDEIQKLEITWGNGTSTTVGPLTGDKLIVVRQEK